MSESCISHIFVVLYVYARVDSVIMVESVMYMYITHAPTLVPYAYTLLTHRISISISISISIAIYIYMYMHVRVHTLHVYIYDIRYTYTYRRGHPIVLHKVWAKLICVRLDGQGDGGGSSDGRYFQALDIEIAEVRHEK